MVSVRTAQQIIERRHRKLHPMRRAASVFAMVVGCGSHTPLSSDTDAGLGQVSFDCSVVCGPIDDYAGRPVPVQQISGGKMRCMIPQICGQGGGNPRVQVLRSVGFMPGGPASAGKLSLMRTRTRFAPRSSSGSRRMWGCIVGSAVARGPRFGFDTAPRSVATVNYRPI